MDTFLFRSGFAHVDNIITKRCSKTITWLFLSRLQGNKPLLNLPKPWTLRNPPEPAGSCLRNLHLHIPEPSGTYWKLPPEPTPAHAGTLRNLLEPSSGTCSCDPHRHTPELIWAEDPISLRCWGKKSQNAGLYGGKIRNPSYQVHLGPCSECRIWWWLRATRPQYLLLEIWHNMLLASKNIMSRYVLKTKGQ